MDAYGSSLKLSPTDAAALNGRGNALSGLKQYDKAIESFERAINTSPKYPNAWNNKGNTLYTIGRF